VNVSGFESYRSAFDLTWTAVNVPPAREEPTAFAPVESSAPVDRDAAHLAREMAAYQFALRVNDRALGVLGPVE